MESLVKKSSLTVHVVTIALLLFLAFAGVSMVGLTLAVRSVTNDLGGGFAMERVEGANARIAGRLQKEAALARQLADSPTIHRWLRNSENETLREEAFAELESYRNSFQDDNYFIAVDKSLTYYNQPPEGDLVQTPLDPERPADEWYFATAGSSEAVSFNLDYNPDLDVSRVWINCLVRDDGEFLGIAGTGIEITELVDRLVSEGRGNTTTMLTDLDGIILAHPNAEIMEANARAADGGAKTRVFDFAGGPADRQVLTELMDAALAGEIQAQRLMINGRSLIAAVTHLTELDAFLVGAVDPSAFVSLRDFTGLFVLVIALILVALAVLAVVIERRVLSPLTTLTTSARKIADGEYHLSLPTRRRDEIGTLSQTFSEMAAQIQAYTGRLENMVQQRTAELEESNRQLDATNRALTESIEYARLIQEGVSDATSVLRNRLPGHSVFQRQRDIVGGDALFAMEVEDGGVVLAVVDCEGHGVSGALMTMMAGSFLRQIIPYRDPRDPAGILTDVEEAVHRSLSGGEFTSGFDIGLCTCLPGEGRVIFAGAGMPIYVREAQGEVRTIAGRRKAIRSRHRRAPERFRNVELDVSTRAFFLFTDGFVDQAGGSTGRAYGTRRLERFLSSWKPKDFRPDSRAWETEFDSYRSNRPQRDDVLCLSFTFEVSTDSDTLNDNTEAQEHVDGQL